MKIEKNVFKFFQLIQIYKFFSFPLPLEFFCDAYFKLFKLI